jgi:predicted ATPase/DNA-binding SARP family transcriptional activator
MWREARSRVLRYGGAGFGCVGVARAGSSAFGASIRSGALGRAIALDAPQTVTIRAGGQVVQLTSFRILGPVQAWSGEQRLALGGTRQLTLFALLVLRANRAVSSDALIDTVWGSARSGADNRLKMAVARLRKALVPLDGGGEPVLRTVNGGYLLSVAPGELDAAVFEARVVDGRRALDEGAPARAAELLRDALALWRGPPLAELAFEDFAQPEIRRLEELWLLALEARVDAELALGRHYELVPELEALAAEYPFRERLTGELMTALYRCERQADASHVYHETRARLVEELGIEPGATLRELHQRVLDQDPALRAIEHPRAGGAASAFRRPVGHNLPAELTSFIGRERELEELARLLCDSRLLTLTGPGGSGKTRLAVRLARSALDRYPDGVWLVELAPLAEPSLVAKTVGAALGVRERPEPMMDTLQRQLRSAQLLLVLDNCEHLVGACAELANSLLTACEGLLILATSREPLGLAGELVWPVPGLAVPERSSSPAERDRYAAVRLFAERAAASKPAFALDPGTAASAAEVCRRLDGMPLAIELAAARVRALSPGEIERRLSDRFALLAGGNRGAAARQQSLRATVDWSHALLEEDERALFRRLSVFAGGWTADHAEQVCADERLPKQRIFAVLCALVEKSLVAGEAVANGSTRYRMLETLREYGQEQLEAVGEQDRIHRRHLAHFLELAERSREQKPSTGADAGLAVLDGEQDNLRAAVAFAREHDPPGLLRLAGAMGHLIYAGSLMENRRWVEEALARSPEPSRERARALHALALFCYGQQDRDKARELAEEAIAVSANFGDEAGEAWARLTLGLIEIAAENYTEASLHLERALAAHEALGQRLGVARARIYQGIVMTMIPDSREAGRGLLRQALKTAQELEDRWGECFGLFYLGWADFDAGDRALAAARFRGARMTDAPETLRGAPLVGMAALACEQDPRRALRLLAAAASHNQPQGVRPAPVVQRRLAAVRAQAERQLDHGEAKKAWNEGLRMTTDEATAYALLHHNHG